MITLTILVVALLIQLAIPAWVLAISARVAGSPRGRFGMGFLAAVSIFVVTFVFAGASFLFYPPRTSIGTATVILPLLAILEIGLIFCLLWWIFKLSIGRTFLPLVAWFGMSMVCLALLAFGIKTYVAEALVVSTPSMSPTINPGERVLADKWTTPQRWDLVVYKRSKDRTALYCKRLIALPGERLRFEGGKVYINDKPQTPPAVLAGRFRAGYPGGPPSLSQYADGQTITLGPDEYFVIGDNFDLSLDSRADGPSHRTALIGVVDAIYWPPNRFRIFH